jgi:hypothetical protein
MIIVLKDADFSANNIGQIVIPKELHTLTKKILATCKRFSESDAQVVALDNFINAMDDAGVLEHLGGFMLPWFSSTVEQAAYDFISETQFTIPDGQNLSMPSPGLVTGTNSPHYAKIATSQNMFGTFVGFLKQIESADSPILKGTKLSIQPVFDKICVQKTTNFTVNGYQSTANRAKYFLFEYGSKSALEQSATTLVNGQGLQIRDNGTYDASVEPLGETITDICPGGYASTTSRYILFWGDGTMLTSTQRTALLTAMNTFVNAIYPLESD